MTRAVVLTVADADLRHDPPPARARAHDQREGLPDQRGLRPAVLEAAHAPLHDLAVDELDPLVASPAEQIVHRHQLLRFHRIRPLNVSSARIGLPLAIKHRAPPREVQPSQVRVGPQIGHRAAWSSTYSIRRVYLVTIPRDS